MSRLVSMIVVADLSALLADLNLCQINPALFGPRNTSSRVEISPSRELLSLHRCGP